MEFGFKIPPNIYGSLFEALTVILTKKLDISKDFLALKLYKALSMLLDAQNSKECLVNQEERVLELVKFVVSLVK